MGPYRCVQNYWTMTLLRPGIPARIDPYSYHVKNDPAMLDWELRGGAA